jgi:hypothetical protein
LPLTGAWHQAGVVTGNCIDLIVEVGAGVPCRRGLRSTLAKRWGRHGVD